MIDLSRELIAYSIIGAVFIIGTPFAVVATRRRRRLKLRRRGIKHYGH